ncbi:hypothetical protein [Nocardia sp. BMG51109]|uniref:hypothetical protein n=1 Tax=Nocardia sp. BMG51109 TaxID=1056816 RepID=UPI000A00563F|nr:hypothetical protein [Nocardia sp. BMG51109]
MNDVDETSADDVAVQLIRRTSMTVDSPDMPKMTSRWIIEPDAAGWPDSIALGEWQLDSAGWEDVHPNDEINVIIEGELHVESRGIVVVATVGDTVRVAKGSSAKYWAPRHARMIVIQSPNPSGKGSEINRYFEL